MGKVCFWSCVYIVSVLVLTEGLVRNRDDQKSIDAVGLENMKALMSALKASVKASGPRNSITYGIPGDENYAWSNNALRSNLKLGHFSWKSCGGADDLFQMTNLTLSTDPIKLGNPIKVTASGQITQDLGSPIEVDVKVEKKVFIWVTLPCVDGLGSCNYPDACALLPPPPCPQPLVDANLPCTCPIPAGTYAVEDLEVEFDSKKYPAWLTEGDFKAHIDLKKGGQSIGCYDVELNIVS